MTGRQHCLTEIPLQCGHHQKAADQNGIIGGCAGLDLSAALAKLNPKVMPFHFQTAPSKCFERRNFGVNIFICHHIFGEKQKNDISIYVLAWNERRKQLLINGEYCTLPPALPMGSHQFNFRALLT